MTKEIFKTDIINYMREFLGIENTSGDTKLKDTGADSLDVAEIAVEIEKKYGITLSIDFPIAEQSTVNHLAEYFAEQVK